VFKRDLFDISDEQPLGIAEAFSPATDQGDRSVSEQRAYGRDGDPASRPSRSWHATAALLVASLGLLLSLLAVTRSGGPSTTIPDARRAPAIEGRAQADRSPGGLSRRRADGRRRKERPTRAPTPARATPSARAPRRLQSESASPVADDPVAATSAPLVVPPAPAPTQPRPVPAASVPAPVGPPRAAEFDFEVRPR
jgi:hypothetical protein